MLAKFKLGNLVTIRQSTKFSSMPNLTDIRYFNFSNIHIRELWYIILIAIEVPLEGLVMVPRVSTGNLQGRNEI